MGRKAHLPLTDLQGIRDEMLRLYNRAKYKKIDAKLLGKLIYCLNSVSQIVKDIELVERLEILEEAKAELECVAA